MYFEAAPDVQKMIDDVLSVLHFPHIDKNRVIAFRSHGSVARARARIWSMPRIWQLALSIKAHYVIEVISHYFDNQTVEEQTKTIIHELMHIPKSFSGALVPHKGSGGRHQVHHSLVSKLYREYTRGKNGDQGPLSYIKKLVLAKHAGQKGKR